MHYLAATSIFLRHDTRLDGVTSAHPQQRVLLVKEISVSPIQGWIDKAGWGKKQFHLHVSLTTPHLLPLSSTHAKLIASLLPFPSPTCKSVKT